MCVDLTLFPLDTIKTRLQSQQGFYKAGGFRGIYAGVPSAAIGSFPNGEPLFLTLGLWSFASIYGLQQADMSGMEMLKWRLLILSVAFFFVFLF